MNLAFISKHDTSPWEMKTSLFRFLSWFVYCFLCLILLVVWLASEQKLQSQFYAGRHLGLSAAALCSALLQLLMLFPDLTNRWCYVHKTVDLRLPWSNGLKLREKLIKLPVCLCQLQGVNFIRGKGPNHICTCILVAASEPRLQAKQLASSSRCGSKTDNNMEMMVFISTHCYEALKLLLILQIQAQCNCLDRWALAVCRLQLRWIVSKADTLTVPSHYLITSLYRTDKVNDFAIGEHLFKFIMGQQCPVTIDGQDCGLLCVCV